MNSVRCSIASATVLALSMVGGCATELEVGNEADFVLDAAAVLDVGVIVGTLDWVNASTLSGTLKTAA